MSGILLPKNYIELPKDVPSVFLLGPIFGAPQWQDEATRILHSLDPRTLVINPRRSVAQDLQNRLVVGRQDYFSRQRAWEMHYIDLVTGRNNGSAMFWLPGQKVSTEGRVYAGTTRVEFGEMLGKRIHQPDIRFCVGAESDFPNLSIMSYDLSQYAPEKEIFSTLETTCGEALRIAKS